jgi:hypothetical protein
MKRTILAAVILMAAVSCKKSKSDSCSINASSISGSYKLGSVKYKANSTSAETDITNTYYSACERDDVYNLNVNGTYTYVDAGTVCTPSGNDNGTWSVSGNTLTIDGSPNNIDAFDCSSLVSSETGVFTMGDKVTITLIKQ